MLGLIVEAVTGKPLASELKRRIFDRAGLRATTFDTQPTIAGRHMHGYFPLNKRLTDLSVLSPSAAWAAGAIVSTADDVARFYRALLQGRLLRADLLREMESTVPMGVPSNAYGLGLWRTGTIALSTHAVRLRRRLGSQRRLDRLQHERLQQQGRDAPVRPLRQPRRGGVHTRDPKAIFAVGSKAYC